MLSSFLELIQLIKYENDLNRDNERALWNALILIVYNKISISGEDVIEP